MDNEIKNLEAQFNEEIKNAVSGQDIESLRVKYLGRKSALNDLFSRMASLNKEEKAAAGKNLNFLKQKIASCIEEKLCASPAGEEKFDLTFPASPVNKGSLHILSRVNREICAVFARLGFDIIEGAEIEDDWHNFTALNFPADHPSRDAFDTFYLDIPPVDPVKGRHLLRCHTSPSQIRLMEENKPPLAVISPGRVYRPDEVDATHSFMFHQIEGFAVGKDINFSHLKGVLFYFAREFFASDASLRFRPHFFPFTEPSAEVDVSCFKCGGLAHSAKRIAQNEKKCSVCKGKGWLEILGCGMIHPHVLEFCGIDSRKYQGFAFGMGVERPAMLKYGIDDIRLFTENDVKFLEQF